jgi:hypothetical protein
MKYVLLTYQGTAPMPGSDRWKAPTEAEQKAIYSDCAAINKAAGVTPGLPRWGCPHLPHPKGTRSLR